MEKRIKVELLEDFRKSHNMTKTDFCKFCNISTSAYRNLLAGKHPRKLRIVFNILCATKISAFDLLGV